MSIMTAIGMMSGTSLDGVDAAILRTDGLDVVEPGAALHIPYDRDLKIWIRRAIKAALEGRDGAADIGKAAREVTMAHVAAVEALLEKAGIRRIAIDVIGFHGQTILHRPARSPESTGRTWQIGDGRVLAEETKIGVVCDFRSADVAAGGEGAPLAPVYHAALARALGRDHAVGVLNLGGVANVTYAPADGAESGIVAFDCGPGNGLIDEWMELKTGKAMDEDGALARRGRVHTDVLRYMLLNPYLRRRPPKSLDRYDFKLDPVLDLSVADGAATLTAFTAACVRDCEKFLPSPPGEWIVCGGGRRNPALMEALEKALDAPTLVAENVGWRGDDLEAECFAYLAVRSLKKLPLSFPKTTRVPRPMTGGVFHRAPL
ncbi:anhydro-N-acetylmuramic acid kinase [Amphiplicatus metriothermophilus]|nr:anhydro-N-acetylmuramic acid kinase [Amphiplicatus metriothermophilus]MBB5520175.1 anhydro-N-acetylmuramic acid kinase [Amphiplicatus metriothermophilus]